jgi:hypothetical protein
MKNINQSTSAAGRNLLATPRPNTRLRNIGGGTEEDNRKRNDLNNKPLCHIPAHNRIKNDTPPVMQECIAKGKSNE